MNLRDFWKRLTGQPTMATPPAQRVIPPAAAPAPAHGATPVILTPALTVDELAFQLLAEYPGGIAARTLWERCEAERLPMADVDRALDDLREILRQEEMAKVKTIDVDSLRVLDLTSVDSVRMRIKGVAYWVTVAEREEFGALEYLLVREPDNEHDANAIAVYGHSRKVGHVSAARAAALAPLLDQLTADAFKVTGTTTQPNSSVLWVDVPKVPALRSFARDHS